MNRLPIIGGLIALILIILSGSVFVLNERDQAIVVRFGKIQRVVDQPGLYFKAPLAIFDFDTVQIVEDRLIRLDRDDLRVQVSGGKFYVVDAFLVYRITDARKFRETVSGSLTIAERQLGIRFEDGLRAVYGRRGFKAALSEERLAMMLEVRDQLRPEAAKLGLNIEDVRVLRTDLTNEVSVQTFERMSAERLAEAERLRARGREAERRIKASADRGVVETKAKAQREAEILRGQGEAENETEYLRMRSIVTRNSLLSIAQWRLIKKHCKIQIPLWCCRQILNSSASSRMLMARKKTLLLNERLFNSHRAGFSTRGAAVRGGPFVH